VITDAIRREEDSGFTTCAAEEPIYVCVFLLSPQDIKSVPNVRVVRPDEGFVNQVTTDDRVNAQQLNRNICIDDGTTYW